MFNSFLELEKSLKDDHDRYLALQRVCLSKMAQNQCFCEESHRAALIYIKNPNKVLCSVCSEKLKNDDVNEANRLFKGWAEESIHPGQ